MKKQSIASALVAAVAVCGAGTAHAQDAGSMLIKVGVNKIMPKVQSGDLSPPALPGSTINIQSASALFITANYFFTQNVSMEFLGGLPYKHTVVGSGAVSGVGTLGTIHQVSPTVLLEYHFLPGYAVLRPYVGAGLTYARFYGTDGSAALTALTNPGGSPTTIGGDNHIGATLNAGLNYKFNSHWFADVAILKTYISTNTVLSTGQTISAHLNPVAINGAIGYRF